MPMTDRKFDDIQFLYFLASVGVVYLIDSFLVATVVIAGLALVSHIARASLDNVDED